MADIFLSYKREDRPRVEKFYHALRDMGFDVAWDQEILTGDAWEQWILRELVGSNAVIVFWSRSSVESEIVKKEARLARDAKKLLPVFIDSLSALERARLMGFDGVQHTDLSNWDFDLKAASWLRLVNSIEAIITPAYTKRKMEQLKAEAHASRRLSDSVTSKDAEYEAQLRAEGLARLEASKREKVAVLELQSAQAALQKSEASLKEREAAALQQAGKIELELKSAQAALEKSEASLKEREAAALQQAGRFELELKSAQATLQKSEASLKERDAVALQQAGRIEDLERSIASQKDKPKGPVAPSRLSPRNYAVLAIALAAVAGLSGSAGYFASPAKLASAQNARMISEKDAKLWILEANVARLNASAKVLASDLATAKEALASSQSRVASLQKSMAAKDSEIASLKSDRSRLPPAEVGHNAVVELQRHLHSLGYYNGAFDGVPGKKLTGAVAAAYPDQGSSAFAGASSDASKFSELQKKLRSDPKSFGTFVTELIRNRNVSVADPELRRREIRFDVDIKDGEVRQLGSFPFDGNQVTFRLNMKAPAFERFLILDNGLTVSKIELCKKSCDSARNDAGAKEKKEIISADKTWQDSGAKFAFILKDFASDDDQTLWLRLTQADDRPKDYSLTFVYRKME